MHQWVLWVLLAASALHVVEEHALGWQGWASERLGPLLGVKPSWSDFWAANAALIVFGFAAASVGWKAPAFSLGFAALALINAIGFHVVPSVQARHPNPGCFTAVLLYIPIGIWAYAAAGADDRLSAGTIVLSLLIGAIVMATALGTLVLGARVGYADDPLDQQPPGPRSAPPN